MTATTESQNQAYAVMHSSYPWTFDEYSEPRTIPPYWGDSEISNHRQPSGNGYAGPTNLTDPKSTARLDTSVSEA
jgi:hypothetical protein